MQILTPDGYKDIADCQVGDEVVAFDIATGAPIVNTIEVIEPVDAAEFRRWWAGQAGEPPFTFYRINGAWTVFREQSVWANGNIKHAHQLAIGDVVYDENDNDIVVASLEEVEQALWYRLEISGDHSFIDDGLTLHNASRFWVGGTGTWDGSATTHWAATTGGGSGASVPGSADTVTLDGSSGGGTCTVNTTVTVQSITCGAFTGTLSFSANNNNVTLSAVTGMNCSGSGTRTINLGNGTWLLTTNSNNSTPWNFAVVTGLTLNANSSTIEYSGVLSGILNFQGGGKTYNNLTLDANASGGSVTVLGNNVFATVTCTDCGLILNATQTITTLTITGKSFLNLPFGTTTITTLSINGSASFLIGVDAGTAGSSATLSVASGSPSLLWTAFRDIVCTGGATFNATKSFDLGHNSGITITPPSNPVGQFISCQRGSPY